MSRLKGNRRIRKHDAEQEAISSAWSKIAADLVRESDRLLQYTAWKNDNYIQNGDEALLDAEDMVYLNMEGQVLYQSIQQSMAKLNAVFAVPVRGFADPANPDKVLLEEDNDTLIANYPVIDIVEWDKRYD